LVIAGWLLFKLRGSVNFSGNMSNDNKLYPVLAPSSQQTDFMQQVVWIADSFGRLVYGHDLMKEFVEADVLEDGTLDWEHVLHPNDVAYTKAAWQKALGEGSVYEIAHRFRLRSGAYQWMFTRAIPEKEGMGKLTRWLGTSTDLNARWRPSEPLRQSKEALHALFELTTAGMVEADASGRFIRVNQSFSDFVGYSIHELLGMRIEEVTHPDFRQLHLQQFSALVFDSKPLLQEKQYIRKDGSIVWGVVSGNAIVDDKGHFLYTHAVIQDVTNRKRTEQNLFHSERQMRLLAESIPQLVWLMNRDGECVFSNKRWEEYSGMHAEGRDIWKKILHPEDMRRIASIWRKGLQTKEPIQDTLRLLNRDGEYRWHSMTGGPIRNEEGVIIRWISVCSDIHEQKTSAERLEMLVAQRTKELQRSNEDLQQFAHVASHDMKEPLRKIKIFGSRLRDECGDELPQKASMYLEKMESAVNRMFSMIDGVLQYSLINATLQQKEQLDLNEVFSTILIDLEVRIQQTSARIEVDRLPMMMGAPVLIYQLFFNLISNALKFQQPGKIPEIDIRSSMVERNGNPFLCIELRDNGIGFEQEYADKIFNSFSRLHSKDTYEGTGLGLSLCKKIVERHHGFIEAEGQTGVGAVFYVFLPTGHAGEKV
jgi:hypothetical protein